jgi:hypothetical protein
MPTNTAAKYLDDLAAALEEIKKFPPMPVRIEASPEIMGALSESASQVPGNIFNGIPVFISFSLAPGEFAFVYRGR